MRDDRMIYGALMNILDDVFDAMTQHPWITFISYGVLCFLLGAWIV